MLQWESIHELNALRLLDCDPHVTAYREQPCEITFDVDGVLHRHFPDILVEIGERKEFWEVKTERDLHHFAARTNLMITGLKRFGYVYRVVTGEELALQPRLDNCRLLLGFGRTPITAKDREMVRLLLRKQTTISWYEAQSGLLGNQGKTILSRLVLDGVLAFDTRYVICETTRFYSRKGEM